MSALHYRLLVVSTRPRIFDLSTSSVQTFQSQPVHIIPIDWSSRKSDNQISFSDTCINTIRRLALVLSIDGGGIVRRRYRSAALLCWPKACHDFSKFRRRKYLQYRPWCLGRLSIYLFRLLVHMLSLPSTIQHPPTVFTCSSIYLSERRAAFWCSVSPIQRSILGGSFPLAPLSWCSLR